MLSTIRPLTRQKTHVHYQHYYLNNSILTVGTLIQQATRFNVYFPGREISYLFPNSKIRKNEDYAPSSITGTTIDNKNGPVNNEIKFETKVSQNKDDKNITAKSGPNDLNKSITDVLRELAKQERAAGDNFRERAYYAAIKSIEAYPKKIESGKEARELKFIGPSIEMKIDEILKTGTCSHVTGYPDSAERQLFNELNKVPRIGRIRALKYLSKGYKTLEEISNCSNLQPDQKYIIKHINELGETIPRWEMNLLLEYIMKQLDNRDNRYLIEACGSFRRGAKYSESLNIVISHPEFKEDTTESINDFLEKFINDLKIQGFCTEYFPKGSSKYLTICRIPQTNKKAKPYLRRKIELRAVPYKNYWLTVLAKTGDEVFYKKLQRKSLENGFRLSETILAPIDPNSGMVGEPLIFNSENDIFKNLNIKYLAPESRAWKGS
ncbi:Nucleotidyltransferase [Rhizophagus irregularis]|uniref:DNA polymerase n=1 Tax=Rhizophagus irregularis TaxID=588596 RepID=A0A2N0QEH1_9GLOM|nr:Nucleotidyltransferase [Rhizophagus irregularis]